VKIVGGMIHSKCGGLGVVKKGDKEEVCAECMGSGLIEVEVDFDEEGNVSPIYIHWGSICNWEWEGRDTKGFDEDEREISKVTSWAYRIHNW
jgi:hypothetical protein